MNLLFYCSYVFFARTYGKPYDRTNERTYLKKIATYLQTKVVRLQKLVERSVDPVAARPPHAAHGPYVAYVPTLTRGSKFFLLSTKQKLSGMMSNESFVLSLIRFFACTVIRTFLRTYGRTYLKKFAMYLQTKVVRLEKLMEGSDLPVAAWPPQTPQDPKNRLAGSTFAKKKLLNKSGHSEQLSFVEFV